MESQGIFQIHPSYENLSLEGETMANASMTPLHSEAIEQENLKKIKKMRAWLIAWLLVGAALIVAHGSSSLLVHHYTTFFCARK